MFCSFTNPKNCEATILSITTFDSGRYRNDGTSNPGSPNYIVGDHSAATFNKFFTFDLSGVSGKITQITLFAYNSSAFEIFDGGYVSLDPFETWSLFDVNTPLASLLDGTGGVAAYNDLGSGTLLGSRQILSTENGVFIDVRLDVNNLLLVDDKLAIGGALIPLDDGRVFAGSSNAYPGNPPRLELVFEQDSNVIPEPVTMMLFGIGMAGAFLRQRKRKHS